MKHIAAFILILVLGVSPALAASPPKPDYAQWMTYYYLHRDTAHMGDFLEWLQDSQLLEKKKNAVEPVKGFLAAVFSENRTKAVGWVKGRAFTGGTAEALAYALWMSGNGKSVAGILAAVPDYVNTPPPELLSATLKNPSDLDRMWGAFFATGNTEYVGKVVDVLDEAMNLTGDGMKDMATRASAAWSLSSNMQQHELVRRKLQEERKTRPRMVQVIIEEFFDKFARDAKPFPAQHGDFSAMLLITDEKQLEEFKKPSSQGMHFNEMKTAKRGDIAAVKIVFAGMELSNDLQANVDFDLKVLAPDGSVYDKVDLKKLEALKKKVPVRFRVYDNSAFLKIRFEPKDMAGKYTIIAEIRDNVGKKHIPLTGEIELTEN